MDDEEGDEKGEIERMTRLVFAVAEGVKLVCD